MHKKYAKALYELLNSKNKEEQEKLLANFFNVLKRDSKEKLLTKILLELEKLYTQRQKSSLRVRLASDKYKEQALKKAKDLGYDGEIPVVKDESLIGGYKIESADSVYDASYKKFLMDLYSKLVS